MAGPYPLETLAAAIGPAGISAPPFQDVYASLQATYQGIYGSDAYLQPDSQDGQLLAAFAAIINDCNNACIAVYNSFSPSTAVGAGLSSNVKLNGLKRHSATHSLVEVAVIGVASTQIRNGVVIDPLSNTWALPPLVIIPAAGTITVTATARSGGAIAVSNGTKLVPVNPTLGWQKAHAAADSSPGQPDETDAQLRQRQTQSTNLPALTPLESIVGELEALPGVILVKAYENDTSAAWTDPPLGTPPLPAHTIALVIYGGTDDTAIATTIASGKLGCGTYGTQSLTVYDRNGVADTIFFSHADIVNIRVTLQVTALLGYTTAYGNLMAAAMSFWVQGYPFQGIPGSVPIGGSVNIFDLVNACWLGPPAQGTYKIEPGNLSQCIIGDPAGLQVADIQMDWNQLPGLLVGNVTVTAPIISPFAAAP